MGIETSRRRLSVPRSQEDMPPYSPLSDQKPESTVRFGAGVTSDQERVIGYKMAVPYADRNNVLSFASVYLPSFTAPPYGVEAVAECRRSRHTAPADECRCGFNAWCDAAHAVLGVKVLGFAMERMLRDHPFWSNIATLRVGLYGDVIEER